MKSIYHCFSIAPPPSNGELNAMCFLFGISHRPNGLPSHWYGLYLKGSLVLGKPHPHAH